MERMLTPGEVAAAARALARTDDRVEVRDPIGFEDLLVHARTTHRRVRCRLAEGLSPRQAHAFRWPKDLGGYRQMTWIDPLDRIAYHALVGRIVRPLEATLDRERVVASTVKTRRSEWWVEPHGASVHARSDQAKKLLLANPWGGMGTLDVRDYFRQVDHDRLHDALTRLPGNPHHADAVIDWLRSGATTYGVCGLPVGHAASSPLANLYLLPGDQVFEAAGVEYVRYVDDTWVFTPDEPRFDAVADEYSTVLGRLNLDLNRSKTSFNLIFEAMEVIESSTITYVLDGSDGDDADPDGAWSLFELGLSDPVGNRRELRAGLGGLRKRNDPRAVRPILDRPDVRRVAPTHGVRYLRHLLNDATARRSVPVAEIAERCTADGLTENSLSDVHFHLAAIDGQQIPKSAALKVKELTLHPERWSTPLTVSAASVWTHAEGWRPGAAVDVIEAARDYSTRRALALGLRNRREDPKFETWIERIRRLDPDLEPTLEWLRG